MSLSHDEVVGEILENAITYARDHDVSDEEVRDLFGQLMGDELMEEEDGDQPESTQESQEDAEADPAPLKAAGEGGQDGKS
jgi:hypothetical protein